MHKLGHWGPRNYIFGDQFYSKNSRMLSFHEFRLFHPRKQMISWFYLKWTEFKIYFEFCSDLIWVKLVAKNIVLRSRGRNTELFLQFDVSLWRNIQIFWARLLHHIVFLVKQNTNLIYVNEKSFCLFNWIFSFVGPCGPISYSNGAKITHAYEG